MFDKLIEFIRNWVEFFAFCTIIDQFENGVVLRLGVKHRAAPPGLRFFWPMKIEKIMKHPVVVDTQELGEQTLTTTDDKEVTITGVITFIVTDVEQILLHVQGEREALIDSAMGVIGVRVLRSSWAEVITEDFWNEVTKEVRRRAKDYGVHVRQVQFKDLTKSHSLRIWNTNRFAEHAN